MVVAGNQLPSFATICLKSGSMPSRAAALCAAILAPYHLLETAMSDRSKRFPSSLSTARCEATLNWLALGLLLAAWNATDNEAEAHVRRPDVLRGYDAVSPRAFSKM